MGGHTPFDQHLKLMYTATHGEGAVTWVTPSGGHLTFPFESGGYLSPPRYLSPPGRLETLTWNSNGTYTLTLKDQTKVIFDPVDSRRARLDRIELGPLAMQVEYYDGSAVGECRVDSSGDPYPEGKLCMVSTSSGRSLHFRHTLDLESGIWRLTAVASGGRDDPDLVRYKYSYSECGMADSTECDGTALCCVRKMMKVDDDDVETPGSSYRYLLSSGEPPRLKQANGANGAIVEKHTWTSGRVSETWEANLNATLQYGSCNGSGSTEVTNKYAGTTGVPNEYCSTFSGTKPVSVVGQCGCSTASFGWSSSADGTLTSKTDRSGRKTTFARSGVYLSRHIANDDDSDPSNTPPSTASVRDYFYEETTALVSKIEVPSVRLSAGSAYKEWTRASETYPLLTSTTRAGQAMTGLSSGWTNPDASGVWSTKTLTTSVAYTLTGSTPSLVRDEPLSGSGDALTWELYPSSATEKNAVGRVKKRKRPGRTGQLETTYGSTVTGCDLGAQNGFDVFGSPYTITDENGVATCLQYDTQGRLTSSRLASESVGTTLAYLADGRIDVITAPDGSQTKYRYGESGLDGTIAGAAALFQTATERWSGTVESSTLLSRREQKYETADLHHNLVKLERQVELPSTFAATCGVESECDIDGYPTAAVSCTSGACALTTCSVDADCSTNGMSVCRSGKCMQTVSLVEYGYDSDRRRNKTVAHRFSTTTNEGDTTTVFDAVGRATASVTKDGGGTTVSEVQYVFNGLDQLTEVKRRVGVSDVKKMISYEYDAGGNLRKAHYFDTANQTTPQSTTEYWHDDFGRLVRVQSPDAGVIVYGYDDAGNVTSEKRADGSVVSTPTTRRTGSRHPTIRAWTRTWRTPTTTTRCRARGT